MRILVTGGAGFIGSHVTGRLVGAGHEVTVLDAWHPAAHRDGGDRVAEVHGAPATAADVRDPEAVRRAVRDVDVVVHQAAMVGMGVDLADLPDYVGCNDLGTAVLLAAMAGARVRRLVLASSMVVYGEGSYACARHGRVRPAPRREADLSAGRFEPTCPQCEAALEPQRIGEDGAVDPRSVYAATKVAQEHLAAAWAYAGGGSVVALRYHNVYGPGMPRDTPYSGVAAIFRSALEAGVAPRVFEDGRQLRDFVHVHDVADANVAAVAAVGRARVPRLQRRLRHAVDGRRDGASVGPRLRRARTGDHRRVPGRRRPPRHGLTGARRAGTGLPGPGEPGRRHDGLRHGPTTRLTAPRPVAADRGPWRAG